MKKKAERQFGTKKLHRHSYFNVSYNNIVKKVDNNFVCINQR